jgi:hypothetical protein
LKKTIPKKIRLQSVDSERPRPARRAVVAAVGAEGPAVGVGDAGVRSVRVGVVEVPPDDR